MVSWGTGLQKEYTQKNGRLNSSEESLREPVASIRKANVQITGVPKEGRKKGTDCLFKETVAEGLPCWSSGQDSALPSPWAWVRCLTGELRSHKPSGATEKRKIQAENFTSLGKTYTCRSTKLLIHSTIPVQKEAIPVSGRFPGGGYDNPLQYSYLENPMDRGTWQAATHGVAKRRN